MQHILLYNQIFVSMPAMKTVQPLHCNITSIGERYHRYTSKGQQENDHGRGKEVTYMTLIN